MIPGNPQETQAAETPRRMPQETGRRRITWDALQQGVAAGIEQLLGAEVAETAGQPGGFSEGLASLLTLTDGRRVFVKAANSEQAPAVCDFHRREIAVTRQLATTWTPHPMTGRRRRTPAPPRRARSPGHFGEDPDDGSRVVRSDRGAHTGLPAGAVGSGCDGSARPGAAAVPPGRAAPTHRQGSSWPP